MEYKFRIYNKRTKQLLNYEDICHSALTVIFQNPDYQVMPYTGIQDCNKTDIYAGDILRLDITPELLNMGFGNSNLGQACKKNNTDQVFLYIYADNTVLDTPYEVYQKTLSSTNIWLSHQNGTPRSDFGKDCDFIQYVCMKGAVIAGNIYEHPHLIPKSSE